MAKIPSRKFSTTKKKIASRKFPKSQRKIPSRKFAKGTAKIASRKFAKGTAKIASRPFAKAPAKEKPTAQVLLARPTDEKSRQERLTILRSQTKALKSASEL
jgi:hypothetical protein